MSAPAPYLSASDRAVLKGAHYVEEAVRVYLMRDLDGSNTWVIDPTTFGEPLYSDYDDGPVIEECQCERPDECAGVVKVMSGIGLPDGEELMWMLADGLGYSVAKVEQS
ncbi:hypothetical protein GQ649_32915 [Rhodococcus sp. DSM 6344]|nr:hypothetical protein [Rhodococcus erythropolis]